MIPNISRYSIKMITYRISRFVDVADADSSDLARVSYIVSFCFLSLFTETIFIN